MNDDFGFSSSSQQQQQQTLNYPLTASSTLLGGGNNNNINNIGIGTNNSSNSTIINSSNVTTVGRGGTSTIAGSTSSNAGSNVSSSTLGLSDVTRYQQQRAQEALEAHIRLAGQQQQQAGGASAGPSSQQQQQQQQRINPPAAHHLVSCDLNQFNTERIANGVLATMPITVKVTFVSKTGTDIDSFGKFCCGGKRTAGAELVWAMTNESNVAHHFECPFHPINLRNGNSIGDADDNNGGIRSSIKLEKYHSGVLRLERTTRSSARKSHSIATWTCCGNDAVKAHATKTYEFIPETENGCCNRNLTRQPAPPPQHIASTSHRQRSASPNNNPYQRM